MNRQEVIQYQVSGVGVVEGVDLDFAESSEGPCRDCGASVDLSGAVTVEVMHKDGTMATVEMTEANARGLLAAVEIAPSPVLCSEHEEMVLELP